MCLLLLVVKRRCGAGWRRPLFASLLLRAPSGNPQLLAQHEDAHTEKDQIEIRRGLRPFERNSACNTSRRLVLRVS